MRDLLQKVKRYIPTVCIFAALVLIYIVGTETESFDKYLFPTVDKIGGSFQKYIGQMFLNLLYSLSLLVPAVAGGTLIGLVLGVIMGTSSVIRNAIHPVVYFISVIPAILLSPFILHAAPTFWSASAILILYNAIWPILFSTINGVMTVEKSYLDKAEILQIKGLKRVFKVLLPSAMPTITSGFITALRGSFLMLVYAEMYGTSYGMGYFVKNGSDLGQYQNVWSGFIFMAIVLVCVMLITEAIKNRIIRWAL